jgi:hypothetical protein
MLCCWNFTRTTTNVSSEWPIWVIACTYDALRWSSVGIVGRVPGPLLILRAQSLLVAPDLLQTRAQRARHDAGPLLFSNSITAWFKVETMYLVALGQHRSHDCLSSLLSPNNYTYYRDLTVLTESYSRVSFVKLGKLLQKIVSFLVGKRGCN